MVAPSADACSWHAYDEGPGDSSWTLVCGSVDPCNTVLRMNYLLEHTDVTIMMDPEALYDTCWHSETQAAVETLTQLKAGIKLTSRTQKMIWLWQLGRQERLPWPKICCAADKKSWDPACCMNIEMQC